MRRTSCAAGAIVLACGTASLPANAQQASGASETGGNLIEDIVVTARRQEESLQSVPVAVTAFSADALEERAIASVADLQGSVPTLQYGGTTVPGGRKSLSFSLRGLRSSAVTVYSSEIVRSSRTVSDLYDLEAVEVLKGPQGTLFGASSTSGAVVFRPARPKDEYEGSIEARIGNYGAYGGTAVFNAPLASIGAIRLAVDGESRDGFVKRLDGGPDLDTDRHFQGRLSFRLSPSEAFENTTVAERYHYRARNPYSFVQSYTPCSATFTSGVDCIYRPPVTTLFGLPTLVNAFNAARAAGPFKSTMKESPAIALDSWAFSNVSNLDVGTPLGEWAGDVKLRAILGYREEDYATDDDSDGLPLSAVFTSRTGDRTVTKSFEGQILGNSGNALTWVLGVYASNARNRTVFTALTLVPILTSNPSVSRTKLKTEQVAGYGQFSVKLLENLRFTAGFRYTKVDVSQVASTRAGPAQNCAIQLAAGVDLAACQRTLSATFKEPSWTVGLDYQIDPDTLLYVASRRGFNAGGFNSAGASERFASYEPERLTDLELGLKRDWRIGASQLRTNLAAYYNWYSRIQRVSTQFDTFNGTQRPITAIINAAKATLKGAELEAELALPIGLKLRFAAAYLDAKYDKFPFTPAGSTEVLDLSNNRVAQAPKWNIIAGFNYRKQLSEDIGTLSLDANYAYQSSITFSDFNDSNTRLSNRLDLSTRQGGYGLLNGRIALENIGDADLTVAFWIRNAFDKLYYIRKTNFGPLGLTVGTPGEPRTLGVTFKKEF